MPTPSSGQTAEHGIDTAAIRADHADPAWSRKHGCAAALRLCDALDRQREETARLQVMAEQASGERYRLRAENMDLRQQRDNARARLDEIRALDATKSTNAVRAILDRND